MPAHCVVETAKAWCCSSADHRTLHHLTTLRIEWQGSRAVYSLFIIISKTSSSCFSFSPDLVPLPAWNPTTAPTKFSLRDGSQEALPAPNPGRLFSRRDAFSAGSYSQKAARILLYFLSRAHVLIYSSISDAHLPQRRFLASKVMRKGYVLHLQTKLHPPSSPKETWQHFYRQETNCTVSWSCQEWHPASVSFVLTFSGDKREQRWATVKQTHVPCGPPFMEKNISTPKMTHIQGTEMQQWLLNSKDPKKQGSLNAPNTSDGSTYCPQKHCKSAPGFSSLFPHLRSLTPWDQIHTKKNCMLEAKERS